MQVPPVSPTVDVRREVKRCPACGQRFSREAAFCPFDGGRLEHADLNPMRDPLLGSVVDGRYQVVALLGEGGMGQVYEVRHVQLDRRFAMKVLRRDLAQEEDLASRFIDEAKATASIRHAHVVQITDFGRLSDDVPYFVMELLVGQTLAQVNKEQGPLSPGRAVPILTQVASALAAAHAAGVIHRDLKPENVFLVGENQGGATIDDVRLVDFGAAKILGSSRVTQQGIVFGTPHYMSPEQASGLPIDHRADVYSLGVIMYEMFTGRVPFEADTYMGVLTQHMFAQPPPLAAAAKDRPPLGRLEEITLKCLAKKPDERYASMNDLGAALGDAVRVKPDGGVEVAPASFRPFRAVGAALRHPKVRETDATGFDPASIPSFLPRRRLPTWLWMALGAIAAIWIGVGVWALVRPGPPRATETVAPTVSPPSPPPSASPPPPPPATTAPPADTAAGSPSVLPAHAAGPTGAASSATPARRPPRRPPPPIDEVGDPFAPRR